MKRHPAQTYDSDLPDVTVLLCAHNPRPDYLAQTLTSLREQTLPLSRWEFFLIDNASDEPLEKDVDIRWHPHGRHLRVDRPGKVHAILRGIEGGRGTTFVTVDDDNVLSDDYLQVLVAAFQTDPALGAVSGRIRGRFERPPPAWSRPFLPFLAVRELGSRSILSAARGLHRWTPAGAGMGFARRVADHYAAAVRDAPMRLGSERHAPAIGRAQDTDMALFATDLGLKAGYLPGLRMEHLIPSARLDPDYMARLIELSMYEGTLCLLARGLYTPRPAWRRAVTRWLAMLSGPMSTARLRRRMRRAIDTGRARAVRDFRAGRFRPSRHTP